MKRSLYVVDMSKNRSKKNSRSWVDKQNQDHFVQQARSKGLRARSVFKLEQIDKKYRLIKSNSKIVDLGSAPGSWSEYAQSKASGNNQIIGVDILAMDEINNVKFIHGDFINSEIQDQIIAFFGESKIDLVLSDMAPNITGIRITDQANAEDLQDEVLSFCLKALNLGGNLLTKLFEGETASSVRKKLSGKFDQIQMVKPDASRSESREIYLLCRGFRFDS